MLGEPDHPPLTRKSFIAFLIVEAVLALASMFILGVIRL